MVQHVAKTAADVKAAAAGGSPLETPPPATVALEASQSAALAAERGHAPPKVVVKAHDMPESMQRVAMELAVVALGRYELERDMAQFLKNQFDERFQPTWHCIVGRHFGSYITSEEGAFLYFYAGKLAVLLFRAGNVAPMQI